MSSKSDDDNADGLPTEWPAVPESSPDSAEETHETAEETDDPKVDREVDKKGKADRTDSSDEESKSPSSSRITRQSLRKLEIDQQKEKFLSMTLESKRKLYRNKYTTLKEISTWPEDYIYSLKVASKAKSGKEQTVKDEDQTEVREDLNKKLSIFQGDITTLEIDAIANAANESLLGGGGVDGAIHRAAGPDLVAECETLDGCDAGDAKITCGYKLPAKYVIHTVGPRGENPKVLKSCYLRCMELVKKHKLKTIAFPCISTGIFGYPNSKAAKVVLKTLREWLENDEYAADVERIILCLFLKVDMDVYRRFLPVYFPVAYGVGSDVSKNSSTKSGPLEETSAINDEKKKTKENKKKSTEKPVPNINK